MSGYDIKRAIETPPFSEIHVIGFSSIYPALGRLNADEYITVHLIEQNGRPDKKVYSLNPKGRMKLLDSLSDPVDPNKWASDFNFKVLLSYLLSARHVDDLLDEKIKDLEDKIRILECTESAHITGPGDEFVRGYAVFVYKAMADYINNHRHELVGTSVTGRHSGAKSEVYPD
jgi:DNA-binding PadR family transcriptional regulator